MSRDGASAIEGGKRRALVFESCPAFDPSEKIIEEEN
jgi:hypothetical protein